MMADIKHANTKSSYRQMHHDKKYPLMHNDLETSAFKGNITGKNTFIFK